MKTLRHHIALTLTLSLWLQFSWGQNTQSVTLAKYTQRDGLSSYYITKIIQDDFGFLWIGTQEGLNLFDGKRFQVFSRQSDKRHRLGGSLITDIAPDKKRNLIWVHTSYGDVCAIDINTRTITHRITVDPDNKPIGEKWIRCLYVQGDTLWMGGLDLVFAYHIENKKYLALDIKRESKIGSGECNISRLMFDPQGRLWLGSEGYGLIVIDKHFNHLYTFRDQLKNGRKPNRKLLFWEFATQHDVVYVATSWGLRTFRLGESAVTYLPGNVPEIVETAEIQSLAFAGPDLMLFSTPHGFYTYNTVTKKLQAYHDENRDDDWLTLTFQVYHDPHSDKIWVGTQAGLASLSIQERSFEAFSKSSLSNTKLKHLYSILPVSENEVYCGDENGLFLVKTLTREITKIDTVSGNYMLFRDASSNIFVSGNNGLRVIRAHKPEPVHHAIPSLKPLESDQFNCALQYNDSLVLFGSVLQKGLTVWNNKSGVLKTFHKDSVHTKIDELSIINFLYKSADGAVFILTEKSIIHFNPVTGEHHILNPDPAAYETPFNNFMDMCETQDSYWIATYGQGVIETDKNFRIKNVITLESGLSNNCVYRIFSQNNDFIVATTNFGLSIIDCNNHRIKNYFQQDGLHGDSFEQGCGYQGEKKIFAGGVSGFTIIDPAFFSGNPTPPSLYLQNIRIDAASGLRDTSNLSLTSLSIPHDVIQTTVHFAALNYRNPFRVNYAYKIDELSDEWIDLKDQNFVNLIGLHPGNYTLQMKASNEDGVWVKNPVKLLLTFEPKWFQTEWFKLSILISGALIIYFFFRYRISQIKKQQQIRKEIANDLHDDIGSTLNTVKIFTHLAQRETDNQKYLSRIEESLVEATLGLRDMIWILDDGQDTVYELMERIKKIVLPVCAANNILLVTSVRSETNKPLTKGEKRNLLLIVKEAINNSIKYSKCKKIHVTLRQEKRETLFRIEDDGVGFNVNDVTTGKGLSSIRYRAKQISFNVNLVSSSILGTVVDLRKVHSKALSERFRL